MKKIILIIISLSIALLFFPRIKEEWVKYRLLAEEVQKLKIQKQNLMAEQEKLKELLIEENKEKILEEQARLTLGLKKEGENVVLILPPTTTISRETTSTKESLAEKSFQKSFILRISQVWYNMIEKLKKLRD